MNAFLQKQQLSLASWILLLLSVFLQFIFSLSHVIALRKLLLIIAFLIAFRFFKEVWQKKPKSLVLSVKVFVLLQVWMLVIAGVISDQPYASFLEWKGQWLPAIMSFVIGIGLARTLIHSKLKDPRSVIAMSILVPITIYLIVNAIIVVNDWITAGTFIPGLGGLGDHHGISGYVVALVVPILLADILSRMVKSNRLLHVPGWMISAVFMLILFTLVATTNRSGMLVMLLTVILVPAITISEIRKVYSAKRITSLFIATLAVIITVAFVSYKIDPRWQNIFETVPVAWDIDRDLLWLDGEGKDLPLTPNGEQSDVSLYSRIAWAHEGWRMLMAHPWGMEIARDTFHKLEVAKYGHAGMAHSHNSWIDFGLEVGIPGLLLWGLLLLLLAQFGWRNWHKYEEPLGLALAILVIMLAIRGMMNSIFRDHEIVQFMLVAGLLFSSLLPGKARTA
jgi:O-antigen ligase